MMMGDNSQTQTVTQAPESHECAKNDPLSWKKLPDVLKIVKDLEQLTVEEKSNLEQMIRREDVEVKDVVDQSGSLQELTAKLVNLARTPRVLEVTPEKVVMEESGERFETAMKKMGSNKKDTLKTSVKTLIKLLQSLQKKPTDIRNRKLNMENIIIKKHVCGVEGAQDFLEAVGFRVKETEKKKVLEIEQERINPSLLNRAIDLLTEKLKDDDSAVEKVVPKTQPRIDCVAHCGFWGDEKTENMCSLCYKKKYAGGAATSEVKGQSPTGPPVPCTKCANYYGVAKFKGMCSSCYKSDSATRRKVLQRRWRIAMTKIRAVRRFKLGAVRKVQRNRKRCWKCQRRLGITGIECRCGYVFCGMHRYAGEHDCPYDFKKAHKKKLIKENLKLTGKKMDKIDSEYE